MIERNIDDYISGEKIQSIANVFLGIPEDFDYNPNMNVYSSNRLDFSTINTNYINPKIVYCHSHRLNLLKEKLQYFTNPFILITHNSDENIDSKYEVLLYSNKIIRWYAQNIQIKHPKLVLLPIGIANSMWPHGNLDILDGVMNNIPNKSKDFYFYFSVSTNCDRRYVCKSEIEKKGLTFGSNLGFKDYLQELAKHKFAICPAGNGIDCHRIWECYYLGVIPILLRDIFSEQLQTRLPCILLNSWDDFDKDTILRQYDELLEQLKTNVKYLKLSHYKNEIENIQPKTVFFITAGRTANNIFQYLAAEVIKHIFNFDIVKNAPSQSKSTLEIGDVEYTKIINDYISNPAKEFSCDTNITLYGYFQKSNILLYLRPILLKYMNPLNTTKINMNNKVSDFTNFNTIHNVSFDDDTLVMHLRLDDFIFHNSPPNIFDKVELGNYLESIKFKKLYIVCDKTRYDWENKYLQYFIDKYNAVILRGSMLDDFNFLKKTERYVISPSTFSWIAAYLGNAKEVYIPYSNFGEDSQILKECHSNCSIKYGIPFASDLKR